MFELEDTHRAFESAVRSWCERELAPAVPAMERGELLPYPLLKQLARELGIAETTAKIHVQHLLRKLGLNSRVQAAAYASEHGLS